MWGYFQCSAAADHDSHSESRRCYMKPEWLRKCVRDERGKRDHNIFHGKGDQACRRVGLELHTAIYFKEQCI